MNVVMNERLEAASARLGSGELRAAVGQALAADRLGAVFAANLPAGAAELIANDPDRIETIMPVASIEAIIKRVGRPALLVKDGQVQMELLPDLPDGTGGKIKQVESRVASVGRIEFANFDMSWGGTGWVIGDAGDSRIVATNRHVAKLVASRNADGTGRLMRNPANGTLYRLSVDFNEEVEATPEQARVAKVKEVVYLADDTSADVALLLITPEPGTTLPDPLELADAEAAIDDVVGLIGYPAFDSRNDVNDQARYFRDIYEVKRFAPGLITAGADNETVLSHDCTSLGGNSGSPLILVDDGKVVGLHFAGVYGVNNSAIGVGTLKALMNGERPVSVTIAAPSESAHDGVHHAADLADRDGYDPEFLGAALAAPWPNLSGEIEQDLAEPSDATNERPTELRYTHFGVKYAKTRRQPAMTAVNIDGLHSVPIKRKNDRWFKDGRIALGDQLSEQDYADALIDRGHMVRREDPNWDPAFDPATDTSSDLAVLANGDTFHYTNSAIQHSKLNQGSKLWLGLESYILENARTRGFKACVFTGPIFNDQDDPEIEAGVKAPLEFWKLVVMVDADHDRLHATAYVLSQGALIRKLIEDRSKIEAVEGFVLGEYRTFQVAIRDLAAATGYDFTAYLAFDPLAKKADNEAVAADEPLFIPLESLANIVT